MISHTTFSLCVATFSRQHCIARLFRIPGHSWLSQNLLPNGTVNFPIHRVISSPIDILILQLSRLIHRKFLISVPEVPEKTAPASTVLVFLLTCHSRLAGHMRMGKWPRLRFYAIITLGRWEWLVEGLRFPSETRSRRQRVCSPLPTALFIMDPMLCTSGSVIHYVNVIAMCLDEHELFSPDDACIHPRFRLFMCSMPGRSYVHSLRMKVTSMMVCSAFDSLKFNNIKLRWLLWNMSDSLLQDTCPWCKVIWYR